MVDAKFIGMDEYSYQKTVFGWIAIMLITFSLPEFSNFIKWGPYGDGVLYFSEFFILTFLLNKTFSFSWNGQEKWLSSLIAVGFAIGINLQQIFTSGRDFGFFEMLLVFAGIGLSVYLYERFKKKYNEMTSYKK